MSNEGKESLVKRFNGDGQDAQKEYRRWKRWSRAYINVQRAKGTPETALGSLLFTLLDGSALRAFDSISMDDIEADGGHQIIYNILDDRFPEESVQDKLGEVLDGIFELKVERGESTAVFTGKARSAFAAAEAEGVKFPDVARGYLLMRFARLSAEKRAIVLAASRQSYSEADVSAALRTTFPEGLYSGKVTSLVAPVETEETYAYDEGDTPAENDVFAAEDIGVETFGDEPIEEQDAVDILMTWKQTRNQINKEKTSRGLASNADIKKMEARVRCFKCKKVGHFSRNCPVRKGQGKGSTAPTSQSQSSRVNFVGMVQDEGPDGDAMDEIILVLQSWDKRPRDYWWVDGEKVIREHVVPRSSMFCVRWSGCPVPLSELYDDRTTIMFTKDGGKKEIRDRMVTDPTEARRKTADDWTGQTIFYRRPAPDDGQMEDPEAQIDAIQHAYVMAVNEEKLEVEIFEEPPSEDERECVESSCNLTLPAGYGVVDTGCGRGVVGEETLKKHETALRRHGLLVEELETKPHRFKYGNGSTDTSTRRVQLPVFIKGREMRMRVHVVPGDVPLLISKRFLKSVGARLGLDSNELYLSAVGIKTQMVERPDGSCQIDLLDMNAEPAVTSPEVDVLLVRAEQVPRLDVKVLTAESEEQDDECTAEEEEWEHIGVHCVFKGHERRELQKQIYDVLRVTDAADLTIMELFSPGRFAELASGFGFKSMGSFDLSDGWDRRKPIHRRRAEQILSFSPPDVLVMTPPCGPLSRLQNLQPMERRKDLQAFIAEVEEAKAMVRWCLKMAERQLALGKDYLFESSLGSGAWSLREMEEFVATWKHPQVNVAACAVGLLDRENKLPFGKKWRFMTSSMTVASMLEPLICRGGHEHQVVEGSSGGQLRSIQTQVYPKKLIRRILGAFAMQDQVSTVCYPISQATIQSPLKSEGRRRVETALRKLHINLGHCSTSDMLRILQHHGAQAEVLELVKAFSCDICKANQAPKATRDSAPPRDLAPLRYIGLDVKWLPSWKPEIKIRALNIVCRASGLQQMYPFREGEQECSELLARLYRQWTRSYGRPKFCKFDAGRCNLGQTFLDCLERDGTTPLDVPGEAHEQMGDVEAQGQHFEQMLKKVIQETNPKTYPEWVECVDSTVEARNMLMKRHGHSAYQLVFGRDPEIPGDDLFSSKPDVIANSAILEDAIAEFAHRTRVSARQAVLQGLDHKAARIALNSRPRPTREFRVGDEVAIWRRGRGIKKSSARWRGPGIIAGHAGGNLWVSMPGAFVKCSPEQVRLRTTEEREADRFLVRDLRSAAASLYPEVGMSPNQQKCFTDLTGEERPPGDLLGGVSEMPDCRVAPSNADQPVAVPANAAGGQSTPVPSCPPNSSSNSSMKSLGEQISQLNSQERQQWLQSAASADRLDGIRRAQPESQRADEHDPKRLRVDEQQMQRCGGRVFPPSMPAPPSSAMVNPEQQPPEQVPIEVQSSASSGPESGFVSSEGASATSSRCLLSAEAVRDSAAAAVSLSSLHAEDQAADFVLHCEDGEDCVLLAGGRNEINLKDPKWKDDQWRKRLLAGIEKEANNVIHDKGALKPLSVEESRLIRQTAGERVVPSKLVLTPKMDETGEHLVKARWTARGDKDPDLFSLVRDGKTQAPTISSNGRLTVLQTISSHKFKLQLGDVTGAFLEADNFHRKNGKIYMSGPSNHPIPGFHQEQLFEVVRPIYGLNDSPQSRFIKFKDTVIKMTWQQSRLDPCVFFLRQGSTLVGVMGVHVDDVLIGGKVLFFEKVLQKLRETFPFRKWKEWSGEFCGSQLHQCPVTFDIKVSQQEFAEKLTKPKLRQKEDPSVQVNDEEVTSLRSCLGGALWLAKETRPDLSVQVSMGQQVMPRPTLAEARNVGNVVRRAKQYKDLHWNILSINPTSLRLCLHTDAAFGNAKAKGTQAGYIVGVTNDKLQVGQEAPWSPAVWKSYRLKRVVGSTFAGETQVLSDGLGHVEWLGCHLAEAFFNDFDLQRRGEHLQRFQIQAIVDCKSIFDHLQHVSSPGSVSDKRVAIDLVIIKETLLRVHGVIRWCPTWLQLADALTKESQEAMDILRGAIVSKRYHLHAESTVLEAAAEQRQRRLAKRQEPTAETCAQGSKVFFTTSWLDNMVKVDAKGFDQEEIRALFEVMVSQSVADEASFEKQLTQNSSLCRARLSAKHVSAKFKGEEAMVTYAYHKSTNMITVSCGAVFMDEAEKTLREVLKVYSKMIKDGSVDPLPEGAQSWGKAFTYLGKKGIVSQYLKEADSKPEDGNPVAMAERQLFVPGEEEYHAAIADLCAETARKLHHFPAWRNRLLQLLLGEFGANPDQVIELSGLTEQYDLTQDDGDWATPADGDLPMAQAKAKSMPAKSKNGYRGVV